MGLLPVAVADSTNGAGYKTLLVIHIVAAIAWLGGGLMLTLQAQRARLARNDAEYAEVASSAEFWATRFFVPASLVLLACGFGMIGIAHLGFSKPFLSVGMAGWAISLGITTGYVGPQGGKVHEMLEASGGTVTPEVRQRVGRIVTAARVDLVILFAVVVVMVVQPGGGA